MTVKYRSYLKIYYLKNMNTIKNTVRVTITSFIFLIVPFVVFTLVTSKTDVIAGIRSFVVLTGSMSPSIPQGSIIYTRKTLNYKTGDVITFKRENNIVTHRIYNKDSKGFTYQTKGDANNTVDSELVSSKEVLGKSIFFVPYVGILVLFLKTFPGYALFIIFPTVFFIVFELNNIRKEIMKQAEKKAMGLLSPPRWPKDSSEVEGISN